MSPENEVPSDEEILKHIICETDHYCKPKDLCGNCKGTLIQIKKLLSALRASWEKEKGELEEMCHNRLGIMGNRSIKIGELNKQIHALEAEKKGLGEANAGLEGLVHTLEERVRELARPSHHSDTDSSDQIKFLTAEVVRLKAENARHVEMEENRRLNLEQMKAGLEKDYASWKEKQDDLTHALAEAREACEELCNKAFVDAERTKFIIPNAFSQAVRMARKVVDDPTSQRASEEMKGLREEVNEARSILILLGFHDWPKQKEIDAYLEEMKGLRKVKDEAMDYLADGNSSKKLQEALFFCQYCF